MDNQKCVGCDDENPEWPVVDATTGFRFCNTCWHDCKNYQQQPDTHEYFSEPVAQWLYAIACRREYCCVSPRTALPVQFQHGAVIK